MNIKELREIYQQARENPKDLNFNLNGFGDDSNMENIKRMILFGLMSGFFSNGEKLFVQKEVQERFNINRGTLLQAYASIEKDFKQIKKEYDCKDDAKYPITNEGTANYEFSMQVYELFKVFIEQLEEDIDKLVDDALAIRYPKYKFITKFLKKFNAKYYDYKRMSALAKYNYEFQQSKKDYLDELQKMFAFFKENYKANNVLICDSTIPIKTPFMSTTFFTEKNGFSFDFFSFDKNNCCEKKLYDVIFCPEHSFYTIYSPSNIYSFLLRAKNQLNDDGAIIFNLYNYSNQFIQNDKKSFAVYKEISLAFDEEKDNLEDIFDDVCDIENKAVQKATLSKFSHVIYENTENIEFEKELGVYLPQKQKGHQMMSTLTELKYVLRLDFDDTSRQLVYRDMNEIIAYSPYAVLKIMRNCGLVCEIHDKYFNLILSDRPELLGSSNDEILQQTLTLGIDDDEDFATIKAKKKYLDFYYVCRKGKGV